MTEVVRRIVSTPRGRYRLTVSSDGSRWDRIPSRPPRHLSSPNILAPTGPEPAQQKEKTLSIYTPTSTDVAYSKQLHERAERLRIIDPRLSYDTAVLQAGQQLARGQRIADPDHVLLASIALRWAIDNGVNDFGIAFRAVGPEYERIVAGEPTLTAAAAASDDLDRGARRRMREDPKLTYKAALLLEGASTPTRPSSRTTKPTADESGAVLDEESQSSPISEDEIKAYAKKNGLTYKAALLELDQQRKKV